MMVTEYLNIFAVLIQSTATGYFTYFLIKSNDLLVLSNAQKEEKIAVVSILSAINLAVFLLAQSIISYNLSNMEPYIQQFAAAILSFVLVIGLFVLPKAILSFFSWINKLRKKKGKLEFTHRAIRDTALDNSYHQYIYVFDFANNYIASGYLNVYQYNTDEYNELLLYAPKEPEKRRTVEAVEILFKNNDINILIDYEKKVKLYIVPMDEAVGE
ncbi:hypothetical protein ACR6LS_001890 [Enterococcus faecalis]